MLPGFDVAPSFDDVKEEGGGGEMGIEDFQILCITRMKFKSLK